MSEYIRYYDVDLNASFVSLNDENIETGVAMLGIRGDRSWITRLGVIPERRGNHVGQYLMSHLLDASIQREIKQVQLEVIKGNDPAHQLFFKLGFEQVRELMVVRRPPGLPTEDPGQASVNVSWIEETRFRHYLAQRTELCSWLDENASLLNAGNLRGVEVELPSGENGWVIFQRTPFQLTHFALSPQITPDVLYAALYQIHKEFFMQDTKIENLPVDSPVWSVFQHIGYFEVFRRVEMYLSLE
ncbi:MAG TPA: GNAT family N-acetyltransferase [Phototrophicaceae bacterium]|nr:GNAT family N-acetyltransferase [Phototrophicaceae bacterium]